MKSKKKKKKTKTKKKKEKEITIYSKHGQSPFPSLVLLALFLFFFFFYATNCTRIIRLIPSRAFAAAFYRHRPSDFSDVLKVAYWPTTKTLGVLPCILTDPLTSLTAPERDGRRANVNLPPTELVRERERERERENRFFVVVV